MSNLNQLEEEDIEKYKNKIIESVSAYEIKQNEILKTENGNTYIHIIITVQGKENTIDISMYYTIMNGYLITTSFRYYNQSQQPGNEQEKETVQNIEFYEVERPILSNQDEIKNLGMGISVVLIAIITIIVLIIRRKDKKIYNNNVKDIKLKQYSRFGGPILLFWSLCFYQILLHVIDIDNANKIKDMEFYTNAVILQSTILSLISIYQIYITIKRKQNTPKKIIISNIIMGITGIICTSARMIYALINPLEIYTSQYFKQEWSILTFGIIYPLIWIIYFIFSKRVQYYYYLPIRKYKDILKESKISKWHKNRKDRNNVAKDTKDI